MKIHTLTDFLLILPHGLVYRIKTKCPIVGPERIGILPSVGGISKESLSLFTRVLEKTTENSELICQRVLPGIQPDTSRPPVLSAELVDYW